jgi:peptide/nickel transport system substrate-binding protein
MVLAEPVEPASLNPLAGYAPNGSAKLFDGLYEHDPDGSLRPVLADSPPVPSADGRSWTVTIRTGIRFGDDTPFAIVDVLATYRALINPAFASPLRSSYSMLTGVDEVSPTTVRFDLAYPYAPFPDKLVLGILPAPSLKTPVPVERMVTPVGTGPYRLVSWAKGKQLVLAANPLYAPALGGPPKVKKVTVLFVPADTDRVARLKAGTLDGAAVAPDQAAGFAHSDAFSVLVDHSSDLRAVQLPAHGPVTGDKAVRLALNLAVDRPALVDSALNGDGSPASTPLPSVLPEFVDPTATFTLNQDKARTELLNGGWVANTSGGRAKEGVPAAFRLDYPTGDAVDAKLATAFVTDARSIGITVTPVAVPPGELSARAATDAVLISTGNPFDPDLSLYPLLAGSADPAVAHALDTGRHTLDPAQRSVAYRQFQDAYVADPDLVCLVFAQHTYVMRNNWSGYAPVVDGSAQGVTWGPWWNLAQWTPR